MRIIFRIVYISVAFLGLSFQACGATTDLEMASQIRSLCPLCTDQELHSQQLRIRDELIDLGATKLAKHPGFYSVNDPLIPPEVQLAAKSVVQIFILAHDATLARRLPVELLEQNLPEMQESTDPTVNVLAKIIALYLARCKAVGAKVCAVPGIPTGMIGGGSAFVVGPSGTSLWTANHVFADALLEIMKGSGTKQISDIIRDRYRFDVLLFDSEGNLIASPFDNSARIAFAASRIPMSPDSTNPVVDSIRLELEHPIKGGLKLAAALPAMNSQVFHIGYPSCTGCSDTYANIESWLVSGSRFPFADALGNALQITIGSVIQILPNIATNADSGHGMSGGVSVNAQGEVIGINSRGGVEADLNTLHLARRKTDIAPVH